VPPAAGGIAKVWADTKTWRPVVSWLVAVVLVGVLACGVVAGAAVAAATTGLA
jgi:hypothetical protein